MDTNKAQACVCVPQSVTFEIYHFGNWTIPACLVQVSRRKNWDYSWGMSIVKDSISRIMYLVHCHLYPFHGPKNLVKQDISFYILVCLLVVSGDWHDWLIEGLTDKWKHGWLDWALPITDTGLCLCLRPNTPLSPAPDPAPARSAQTDNYIFSVRLSRSSQHPGQPR